MNGKETRGGKPKNSVVPPPRTGEIVLQPSGEVVVSHEDTAARAPEGKRIHPRRVLPLVPQADQEEGAEGRNTAGPDERDATTKRRKP